MLRTEILGREKSQIDRFGKNGCGYIGKIVSYPVGKYEEVGEMYLDLVSPHCMTILGKRGSGKSYTMGVLAEEFGFLPQKYRNRIAVLMVDTMSVFHSLKVENNITDEVISLRRYGNLLPKGFPDYARIFMPKSTIDRVNQENKNISYDRVLQLPLKDIEVHDWLVLFDLRATEPAGVLLNKVIDTLQKVRGSYGFGDIYDEIRLQSAQDHIKEALENLFKMVEKLQIFDRIGTPYEEIVRGGQLSVLDLAYLGQSGVFDLRNLVVAVLSRKLLTERTLYTTLELQEQARMVESGQGASPREHPLVYMMIDEAHLFLPREGNTLSSKPLMDWINLGRHPGLSLIMATQTPSSLHPNVLKQSDMIIAHNLTSSEDIESLSKIQQTFMTGSLDFKKLVASMEFRRGLSVVFDDKTRKIEMCRVRPRCSLHLGLDATALPPEELQRFGPERIIYNPSADRSKRPVTEIIKDLQVIKELRPTR